MASYAAINSVPSEHAGSRPASTSSQSRRGRHAKQNGVGGSASWTSSVINLVNTIVGAGVLAMPHAMSNMGVTLGVIIILWAGLTSGFGLYLQTRCARYLDRGGASFFALSQITYPGAAIIFDAAIMLKCFGVGVSYLIIIGDLMPGVVRGFINNIDEGTALYLIDRQFWVTAFMLIVIPLSFLRKLDSLKYTSMVALVSISYLVVLVVYHFAAHDAGHDKGPVNWVKWHGVGATLSSFPVIVFAYTCHQNMFSILNEIKDASPRRTTSVVTASIGSAAAIYVLVAITGYLTFGDNVLGNIVAQYVPNVASTIGRAAIVVLVMFSYPLQVHPCRASLDAVLKWRPVNRQQQEYTPATSSRGSPSRSSLLGSKVPAGRASPQEMSEIRFAILTTIIIIMSYIVAMTVSSLDKVLAYVGSTGSTAISFILPGLFYYKISAPDSPHHQRLLKDEEDEEYARSDASVEDGGINAKQQARGELLRKLSLAIAIYGICVMIVRAAPLYIVTLWWISCGIRALLKVASEDLEGGPYRCQTWKSSGRESSEDSDSATGSASSCSTAEATLESGSSFSLKSWLMRALQRLWTGTKKTLRAGFGLLTTVCLVLTAAPVSAQTCSTDAGVVNKATGGINNVARWAGITLLQLGIHLSYALLQYYVLCRILPQLGLIDGGEVARSLDPAYSRSPARPGSSNTSLKAWIFWLLQCCWAKVKRPPRVFAWQLVMWCLFFMVSSAYAHAGNGIHVDPDPRALGYAVNDEVYPRPFTIDPPDLPLICTPGNDGLIELVPGTWIADHSLRFAAWGYTYLTLVVIAIRAALDKQPSAEFLVLNVGLIAVLCLSQFANASGIPGQEPGSTKECPLNSASLQTTLQILFILVVWKIHAYFCPRRAVARYILAAVPAVMWILQWSFAALEHKATS